MEDLNHFDVFEDFSASEAAALIAGIDCNDPTAAQHRAMPALARLKEGYRVAMALVTQQGLTAEGFKFQRGMLMWSHALISKVVDFYGGYQPPQWFNGPDGNFEQQRFARSEIHRWLEAEGVPSKYQFMRQQAGAAVLVECPVSVVDAGNSDAGDSQHPPAATATAPTVTAPQFSVPKGVLVIRHKLRWPTIESDLGDASKNGLAVAKAGKRGWREAGALEWARQKGKLTEETHAAQEVAVASSIFSLPGKKHSMGR